MDNNKNNNKLLDNIGLCKKAGKITVGFDAVVKELPKTAGVVTAADISPKTLKELKFQAEKHGCPVAVSNASMDDIAKILKKRVGIIGIMDEGLFNIVIKQF